MFFGILGGLVTEYGGVLCHASLSLPGMQDSSWSALQRYNSAARNWHDGNFRWKKRRRNKNSWRRMNLCLSVEYDKSVIPDLYGLLLHCWQSMPSFIHVWPWWPLSLAVSVIYSLMNCGGAADEADWKPSASALRLIRSVTWLVCSSSGCAPSWLSCPWECQYHLGCPLCLGCGHAWHILTAWPSMMEIWLLFISLPRDLQHYFPLMTLSLVCQWLAPGFFAWVWLGFVSLLTFPICLQPPTKPNKLAIWSLRFKTLQKVWLVWGSPHG